jgi:subtilisin family serine protease
MSRLSQAVGLDFSSIDHTTLAPVEVAVIDSGIDASHPDLVGRVKAAYSLNETSGRVEMVQLDCKANNDAFGHGTAVASIICRVAPNAVVTDIRVLGADNKGTGDRLVGGLRAAVRSRCRLINMSIAAPATVAPALGALCDRAWYQRQTVVAAKRNVPITNEGFPAEFANCIGVDSGKLASPYDIQFRDGRMIELAALGEDVPVAVAGGGYTSMTGTSFATPTVTALCALLLGRMPDLTPFEVRTLLKEIAEFIPER